MHRVLILVLLLVSLAGCQRMSAEQCQKICWRFNELAFWERFEKEAAGLEPEARDKLKAERQALLEQIRAREDDPGRDNCLKECRRAAKPDDVACVEKATTSAAAQACLK
jgi:hypothetical protein